ncbi:endo-alpha-N-acetylgalactosaminidase family protein [Virgibacillus halodenitrificans]|uniref:Bacterial Ig-like domain-containing protein n=1 Tax=Virgibacillus halodenitrificans TaxID=1482 RepID=A0ABR7VGY1_VIRHA|nr:endo-alpha-N-acetylgalactosaminidase family protein [Virgibacillus halodenitrificans]MBD1221214.1 bacterial Ig-like domain-containing protein [Virgibacillus halodenitrificans]
MDNFYRKRIFPIFCGVLLVLPLFLLNMVAPLKADAAASNPWETISTGGNEVNKVVEQNGDSYVRLGTGEGNNNGDNPAIFRHQDATGQEKGVMEYTFIPETEGKTTRFGFFTHYEDPNNFVFVGYDALGWFYQYKYQGEGDYLRERPEVALPQPGKEYTLKIDYDGTALNASLNGKDLFGNVQLNEAVANLTTQPEALRLGKYGDQDTKVLIKTDIGIVDDKLEEGDLNIIQGDGTLTYNEDGSATFGVTSTAKNKVVYDNMEPIKNGVFEADIQADKDLNRFGVIYRVQDSSTYTYVGTGDANDQYFSEIFLPENSWTAMTKGIPLQADQSYHLRVKFINDTATLYVDGEKIDSWSQPDGVDEAGLLGFEKSRGAANVTISNVKITESSAPEAPDTEPIENTLSSDEMEVTIDEVFPRVINYNVDGKVMHGQESPVYGLNINGMLYYPEVAFEKVSDNEAVYTMSVTDLDEKLDAEFKLSLKVEDNKVVYSFDEITNKADAPIETIDFADMNFISVNAEDGDAKAKLTNLSSDVTKPGDTSVTVDAEMQDVGTSKSYYTAFLSTDELSAGVWSSSEVNGYKNLIANRFENEAGVKAMGIGSSTLYYHREFMPEPSSNKPTIKIVITEDTNGDEEIDWQDAAIEYRDLMKDIKGADNVNNTVGTRIAMNFGSQAQQPFLKTLDNVKKVALATDGMGQAVLLKGYGNEGHDSAHPDYGDVGARMGGAADLQTLIEEGHQYNTEFGVHINAQESYPEADAFSEELINSPGSKGWGWLDQSYTINKLRDLYSGARAERMDALAEAAPGLDFIYLDVWYQDQWESNRVAEQIMDRGWRMTTEFGTAVANYSTWQHWATDKNYGGPENKGINSDVLRFIGNHQKDSWVLNWPEAGGTADHPLLGGFELAGFEGWQSDKNFDHFIRKTFDTNVPTKFLQKYYVTDWEKTEGDPTETNLEKEITLKDPSNDDTVIVKRKDDSRERIITLNGNVVLDGDTYLIPWVEQDFETPTPDSEKLYHWNKEGGETTWTLPDEHNEVSTVDVYKLTDQGRTEKQTIDVTDHQITLQAEAATPYIVVAGEDEGVAIDQWGTENLYDGGFNTGTIDDEHTTVEGDADAVSVIRTDQKDDARNLSSGDYYLNFDSPTKDTAVTRTLKNLEPGKEYVAEVYVENASDVKASIKVNGAKKDVSNYTLRSLQKNYVKADSHATNDGYNSKMQRMQVSFTAESETAELVLHRKAGEGMTKFDEVRVVQKALDNYKADNVFEQDFENVLQGIYPFVIGNTEGVNDNRIHLAELHAPYTQKGWADKKVVDDVLDGNWSVKVNTGNSGLVYRTIPQHFHFEADTTYKVSFDYQTTADSYRFIAGDQAIDVRSIDQAKGLQSNDKLAAATETKTAEFTIKGSENGQTYIGIFNDGTSLNMDTGAGTFMLDNLRIEQVSPVLEVSDKTITAGDELDLSSLIEVARDVEGNDRSADVVIDEGDFDASTPGTYEITYTLHVDGYDEVVATATVTVEAPPISSATDLKEQLDQLEADGEFANKGAARSLHVHLSTVERFEKKDQAEKVVKHLKGFEKLLDNHIEKELLSEKAYTTLKIGTETLLDKWK